MGKTATSNDELRGLSADIIKTPEARLGEILLPPGEGCIVFDFGQVRQVTGENIGGIVCPLILQGNVVTVDFDQGTVNVVRRELAGRPRGESCPLRVDTSGRLWLDNVMIGSRSEAFMIATNSQCAVRVHSWLFNALLRDGDVKPRGTLETAFAAQVVARRWGRLSRLTIGNHSHPNVVVEEGNNNLLGLDFLSRYIVTFDVSVGRVYFQPGKCVDKRDDVNRTGLHVAQKDGTIEIASVEEGSPAQVAGLQAGDRIIMVGGRSPKQLHLLGLRRLLRESPDKTITISVIRSGNAVDTTLFVATE